MSYIRATSQGLTENEKARSLAALGIANASQALRFNRSQRFAPQRIEKYWHECCANDVSLHRCDPPTKKKRVLARFGGRRFNFHEPAARATGYVRMNFRNSIRLDSN